MSFKAPAAPPPQMKPNRPQPMASDRDAPAPQQRAKPRKPGQVPLAVKIIVSLLVTWHVAAVFLAPLSIQPSSPLVQELAQHYMQWYLDALYINHGYHFFAPEPGPGHLIHYQLTDDAGRVTEGEFPSKSDNWPRLLYHRYFMLAEQCEVGGDTEAEFNRRRDDVLKGYARQILRAHPEAAMIRLKRIVHYPLRAEDKLRIEQDPTLEQYREDPLAYPPTYQDEVEVIQRRTDLDSTAETAAATTNWRQDVASGWQGGVR
jgi:hypothetical protein